MLRYCLASSGNSFSRASGFPLFRRGTWCIAHKIMLHASLHRHVFCTCPIQSTPEHTHPLPGSLHISLLSSSNNQHNILHRLELQKINFALFHFSSFIFVLRKTSGHYNDRFQLLLFENMHRTLLQCLPPKITVSYLSDSSNTFSGTLANNGLTETRS